MKINLRFRAAAVLIGVMTSMWASIAEADSSFSVYKRDIIDRRPFGEPVRVARPEQDRTVIRDSRPPWSSKTQLVALIQRGRITRVGFLHGGRSYFLRVGDSQQGIRVVRALPEARAVLLEYGGRVERVTMSRF